MPNNKTVGNTNESTVAEYLTKWAQQYPSTSNFVFHRQLGSGAIKDRGAAFYGDIYCEDSAFPFTIECKYTLNNWLAISPEGYLRGNSVVHTFWEQVSEDAIKAGRIPLLIATHNERQLLISPQTLLADLICKSKKYALKCYYLDQVKQVYTFEEFIENYLC